MKIIIRESLDDFKDDYLDYDEDNYYLVDSFKDFKKYGHKGKHHQDIEVITSNFKQLLKDLEKNNIYINDEFKNIKEIDLDKEKDYFILPDKIMNNIVDQLGYTPNPMRTYKSIKYSDKIISSEEFEYIISDKNNIFHWVSKCKFKNAEITAYKGASITFDNTTWIDGYFEDGFFNNGLWKRGVWKNGWLSNSTWEKGIWENGWFENSTWEDGKWMEGHFIGSTWEEGIWENGTWYILKETKCVDINKFNPKNIKFNLSGTDYSFNEIWDNYILLRRLLNGFMYSSNYIYLGNQKLTKEDIEQRIVEIS